MSVTVTQVPWESHQDVCVSVRWTVFVDEQKVPAEEELDGLDPKCTHFLARDADRRPVGTARLWVTPQGKAKAQRVAVLAECRGLGVGRALMTALEDEARARGHDQVVLGAQVTAIPFYERIGYTAEGPEFDDAGIPHRWMHKPLS